MGECKFDIRGLFTHAESLIVEGTAMICDVPNIYEASPGLIFNLHWCDVQI